MGGWGVGHKKCGLRTAFGTNSYRPGFPATDSEAPMAPQPNAQSVSPIVFALLRRGPGHDRDLYYPLQRDDQGSGFVAYKFFSKLVESSLESLPVPLLVWGHVGALIESWSFPKRRYCAHGKAETHSKSGQKLCWVTQFG